MALVEAPTPAEVDVLEKWGFKVATAYMEVPRCNRCRFWSRLYDYGNIGRCSLTDSTNERFNWLFFTSKGGSVSTCADFGCVQFENKEPAP